VEIISLKTKRKKFYEGGETGNGESRGISHYLSLRENCRTYESFPTSLSSYSLGLFYFPLNKTATENEDTSERKLIDL